jgi:succinoglycan biosynthesis transport protein ExoP
MELRDYARILRRRWSSIVIVTLAMVALAATITLVITPKYTATTRLFFAVQGGESVTDLAQGSSYAENQMTSYAEVATSPLVLDPVIDALDLNISAKELAESVTASVPAKTVILEITATDVDPSQAARIANGVGAQLSKVAAGLAPERPDGGEAVRSTILAQAQVPMSPSSPDVLRNLSLGAAFGLLLGAAVALSRHLLDTKIRSEEDLEAVTDRAVLGYVPFDAGAPNHPVVMHDDPLSARSEAVRRLRTNLQFVDVADDAKSIVITSSIPGEGKSTTAINLAVSLGDAGLRVILVDADLRRPAVAGYLGLEGAVGLTTVLIGRAELRDVIQPWQRTTLDIMPAGQIPPNPSELLGSKAMTSLLKQLADNYDMVLLDSSPLLPVTDAAILSKSVGGTLVVVGADRIHRPQLQQALESLSTVDANVLGLVLNKVDRRDAGSYGYYSSYAAEDKRTFSSASSASPAEEELAHAVVGIDTAESESSQR